MRDEGWENRWRHIQEYERKYTKLGWMLHVWLVGGGNSVHMSFFNEPIALNYKYKSLMKVGWHFDPASRESIVLFTSGRGICGNSRHRLFNLRGTNVSRSYGSLHCVRFFDNPALFGQYFVSCVKAKWEWNIYLAETGPLCNIFHDSRYLYASLLCVSSEVLDMVGYHNPVGTGYCGVVFEIILSKGTSVYFHTHLPAHGVDWDSGHKRVFNNHAPQCSILPFCRRDIFHCRGDILCH